MQQRREEIESSINRYLTALDEADQQESSTAQPKAARPQEKIDKLKAQMKELYVIESWLNEILVKQVSLTDPDARLMMTRGTGVVGHNVQTAVDVKHHLIVVLEVTNDGSDRDQLSSMTQQTREAMGWETLSVVADKGYFKSEEILACHDADIAVYLSPFLWILLPESALFLAARNAPAGQIAKVLNKLGGTFSVTTNFTITESQAHHKAPVRMLLSERYRFGTVALWLTYFIGLLVIYLTKSWMPTLLRDSGLSIERAATITRLFQIGCTVGAIVVG